MSELLRVLIVDDEGPARNRIETLLDDLQSEIATEVVGSVGDGLAAIQAVSTLSVDLILTDIRMPRMGGIELAIHLQRTANPPAVIFVTAYDHHAVHAFELNALDYLLKPIKADRLLAALKKSRHKVHSAGNLPIEQEVQALVSGSRRFLSCSERGKLLVIPLAEVIYLRADAKYVAARTVEREFLLDESLLKLEEEFSETFLRLHRSVLVAKNAISGFEKTVDSEGEHWVATLRSVPERLPVSRRQWPLVKQFAKV